MRRLALLGLASALSAAAGLASCVDPGGPDDVVSIQFDSSLQVYPSIVAGDQLRDTNGVVSTLRARVFNGSGGEITDAAVTFLSFDTLLTVTSAGGVTSKGVRDTPARIFATAGGLQSNPLNLILTRRPDTLSLATQGGLASAPGAPFVAESLTVLLQGRDTDGALQPVNAWLTSYRLEHAGQAIAPGDTAIAYLTTPELFTSTTGAPLRSVPIDTTGTDGKSLRVLIAKTAALAKPLDSIVVYATARYHGSAVAGSPVRVVVKIQQ